MQPRRAADVGNGMQFILFGAWFMLTNAHAFGLRDPNSWPLSFIAISLGTVAHALAARWLPDTPRMPEGSPCCVTAVPASRRACAMRCL